MVDFAGYALPVTYGKQGVLQSVLHTRKAASLFDVSHMGQVLIEGPDRVEFAEKVLCADIKSLKLGETSYSLILNNEGNIIDDCVISNRGDFLYLVINAGTCAKDLAHMERELAAFSGRASFTLLTETGLLAIQGPKAAEILAKHATLVDEEEGAVEGERREKAEEEEETGGGASSSPSLSSLLFMQGTSGMIQAGSAGQVPCMITRCGYTGEDGFEVSVGADHVEQVARVLLREEHCELAGLGARDALRLEAGLCLYGHDIDETTTPVEAGLHFALPKTRRTSSAGFIGAPVIHKQLNERSATKRRRVGLIVKGPPAREGAEVLVAEEEEEQVVGRVTSGAHSPTLNQSISMAYVPKKYMKAGTNNLLVKVRNKLYPTEVVKMPFTQTNYYRGGE